MFTLSIQYVSSGPLGLILLFNICSYTSKAIAKSAVRFVPTYKYVKRNAKGLPSPSSVLPRACLLTAEQDASLTPAVIDTTVQLGRMYRVSLTLNGVVEIFLLD